MQIIHICRGCDKVLYLTMSPNTLHHYTRHHGQLFIVALCHIKEFRHNDSDMRCWSGSSLVIGIDHDTVCAGVVGTAIRNSTSCAGRRAAACGHAGRHNECCSGLQYQPLQRRPYKWSISILPRSQFTKSKGNLRFRRLVPLFVPIGVCVTTHDDGTDSDVTIGMWRHNQQVTNHERNGKPWFSLPK